MRHTPALIFGYRRPDMTIRRFLFALAAAAALANPAAGQQQQQPGPDETNLHGQDWYRGELVDLAEVLGGSHYLRILCQGRGDQHWRDYMRGVIQREPQYNDALVEGFNRGYRDQEARFPICDETTRQMEAELRARGLRISQALGAHHSEN